MKTLLIIIIFAAMTNVSTHSTAALVLDLNTSYSITASNGGGAVSGNFFPRTPGPAISHSTTNGSNTAVVSFERITDSILVISGNYIFGGGGVADTQISLNFAVDSPVNARFEFTTVGTSSSGSTGRVVVPGQPQWTTSRTEQIQLNPGTNYFVFLQSGLAGIGPTSSGIASLRIDATAVPEPGSMLLFCTCAMTICAYRTRKKKKRPLVFCN